MARSRFVVEFFGETPDPLAVGDEIVVVGKATVRQITADLIDVTSWSQTAPQFVLGEATIALVSNNVEVSRG